MAYHDDFVASILGGDIMGGGATAPQTNAQTPIMSSSSLKSPRSPRLSSGGGGGGWGGGGGISSGLASYGAMDKREEDARALASPDNNNPSTPTNQSPREAWREAKIVPYALIFINFMFALTALLLVMAGVVARTNYAVRLCKPCNQLTLAPIVVGILLWLCSVYGFNWVRQRNVLLLLAYGVVLLASTIALLSMLSASLTFDALQSQERNLLHDWLTEVEHNDGPTSVLCQLQQRFNCSGFHYGCCKPGNGSMPRDTYCYIENQRPAWVPKVCPNCEGNTTAKVCTNIVYAVMRRNLVGFSVICVVAVIMIVTGILFAVALSRPIKQQRRQQMRSEAHSYQKLDDD